MRDRIHLGQLQVVDDGRSEVGPCVDLGERLDGARGRERVVGGAGAFRSGGAPEAAPILVARRGLGISPSVDRLAVAAHIAARRFRFVFSIGYPFLGFGSGGCDGPCRPGRRPR